MVGECGRARVAITADALRVAATLSESRLVFFFVDFVAHSISPCCTAYFAIAALESSASFSRIRER